MASTVRVVMHLRAKPGREEDVKTILADLPENIRKEPGCLQFDFFRQRARFGRLRQPGGMAG